jgi:DNA repair and recombination protein RadB
LTCVNVLEKIPTDCRTIDHALRGGLPSGSISLVYGEPETGKTTLAMQCAVNCARQGYKTLFVDCDGTFSPQRLSQISSKQFERIAELIILMRPDDFREQAVIIDQLTDYVTASFGLIVLDTFTSLYRLRIAESPSKTFELNRELNRQLAVLAQIARTQKITVLITGQVHSVLDDVPVSIEPVATRVLKFWADAVIALKPTENPQMIKMTLEKNPQKLPVKTCNLIMKDTGMHEYSTH